jgi:4'-phosphopantetheinyl transferase
MPKNASVGNSPSQTRAESGETGSTGSSAQRQTHSAAPTSEAAAWKLAEPVAIWFRVTQSLTAEEVDQARSTLSLDERERCDRLVFERDRRDFAAAHALLRDALSHHGRLSPGDWKFGVEAGGKPYLADQSELQFNIAHTRGLVVCALSLSGPIGVDVESIPYERDIDAISESYFAPAELADLRARHDVASRSAHFTELWTSKEAYLKALGAGLRRPLDEIAFRFPAASEIRAASEGAVIHVDWRFALFAPRSDFRLAVAVRAESPLRFLAREWPEKPDRPGLAPTRWSR